MRTLGYVLLVIVALAIACLGLLFPNEVVEFMDRYLNEH